MDSNSNFSETTDTLPSRRSLLLQPFRKVLGCFSYSNSDQGGSASSTPFIDSNSGLGGSASSTPLIDSNSGQGGSASSTPLIDSNSGLGGSASSTPLIDSNSGQGGSASSTPLIDSNSGQGGSASSTPLIDSNSGQGGSASSTPLIDSNSGLGGSASSTPLIDSNSGQGGSASSTPLIDSNSGQGGSASSTPLIDSNSGLGGSASSTPLIDSNSGQGGSASSTPLIDSNSGQGGSASSTPLIDSNSGQGGSASSTPLIDSNSGQGGSASSTPLIDSNSGQGGSASSTPLIDSNSGLGGSASSTPLIDSNSGQGGSASSTPLIDSNSGQGGSASSTPLIDSNLGLGGSASSTPLIDSNSGLGGSASSTPLIDSNSGQGGSASSTPLIDSNSGQGGSASSTPLIDSNSGLGGSASSTPLIDSNSGQGGSASSTPLIDSNSGLGGSASSTPLIDSNSGQGGSASSTPLIDSNSGLGGSASSTPLIDSNSGQGGSASSTPLIDSNSGQGGSASSTPFIDSNCVHSYTYDVFISFRGADTRNTFVDHLYAHLTRKGIFAFMDDKRLDKGESLSPQLLQAIQNSRISIVVFSGRYAESTWCLEEMATIAECRKEFNQKIFPVFYDVDPSHVRNQNGVYENDFVLHRKKFKHDPNKVVGWTNAMKVLANLVGWDVRNKPESIEIERIVQAVIKSLNHKFSGFTSDLVGMQPRIKELEKLLKLSSKNDDFRVLGIWGMSGVGKTTHATLLYDRISYQFDARCFINNTSKLYMDGGIVAVQRQILRQALDERNLDSYDTCEIFGIMINRLHSSTKVLLVLDNVDQLEQLQELGVNPKLLGSGSRIIITTRDKHILRVYGADKIHKVPLLNSNDAAELFLRKAFKGEEQSSNCVELIPEILKYAQNLPLAIKVVGSFLCTRDAAQWRDALDRLKNNPDDKIMDVLQMSVDGLQHEEKEIFLHIACFFKGEREDYVKRILDACGLYPHIGIQRVIEKSLITIKNQEIHMHDMLQELGKKIVRHNFLEDPVSWSRLWQYNDFYRVLETKTGTNNDVKAIVLTQKENFSKCMAEGFSNMSNLVLLMLYHNNFSGNLNFLSNNLRYLLWHGYPFTSLPPNFEPDYLVELNMPDSSIQQLWEGRKELPSLKRMDLSNSKYLTVTPEFFGTPKLERLDFTRCTNLIKVHPSIGRLTELVFLSLQNCSSLVDLDFGSVSRLSSLRVLRLSGCTKLEKTPDFTGASNLEYLDMDGCTTISKFHESIGYLTKVKFLSLRNCTNLVLMPDRIQRMASLATLDFYGCSSLRILPLKWTHTDHMRSLIFLDLSFCHLYIVPNTIGMIKTLERLNLQGNKFCSLPDSFLDLENLTYLNLSHCHELDNTIIPFPFKGASSGGRYFTIAAGSRDHRSGLYIFDCPNIGDFSLSRQMCYLWFANLLENPQHFRGGFDIVVPCNQKESIDFPSHDCFPRWFNHQFDGGSIVKIVDFDEFDKKFGFAFCVAFQVNIGRVQGNRFSRRKKYHPADSGFPQDSFSSALPHPLYLSFESEHTEERFDMPLSLELHKIFGSKYLWLIYISQEHCHFLKTGAHITFKACPGLLIKKWGVRMVMKDQMKSQPVFSFLEPLPNTDAPRLFFDYVQKTSMMSGTKIQLPYNWFVIEEEEVENSEAKSKEIDLSNLGLKYASPTQLR